MNTKFYLDFRGKAEDGKGSLLLFIFHQRKSVSIPLGIRLSKNEWSGTKIQNRDDSSTLNILINKKKSDIDKRLALLELEDGFESLSLPEIKRRVLDKDKHIQAVNKKSMEYLFNTYMDTGLEKGTREIYTTTLGKVQKHGGKNISIDDITYEWLIGFERFLAKTQGVNGRGIYLRALRAVCNFAVRIGATSRYAFDGFSIKTEETRKRSVPIELLREYYTLPCDPYEERYRDYFFLMFFLIGINAGDLLRLKPDAIVGGRLEYIRAKTHKKYSIKIEPVAMELIEKHRGRKYLLDALDTCKDPKNFIHMMNDALQKIGRWEVSTEQETLFSGQKPVLVKQPLIPDITTYYARHGWATYAYELGINLDTISQALGHSFGNRTTLIYIRFDQTKIDKANKKVIDYFIQEDKA